MFLFLLATALACRAGKSVPEQGSVLLQVKCPPGVPAPDELRAWVYDDGGLLWDGVRIPAQGPLVAEGEQSLGTILIAPGAIQGSLRIHLRGFAGGVRVLDGVLAIDSLAGGDRVFELMLESTAPVDEDLDDVPDVIDDCPGMPNPAQGGCLSPPLPDAAADLPPLSRDVSPSSPDGGIGRDTEQDGTARDSPNAPRDTAIDRGGVAVDGKDAVAPDRPIETDLGAPAAEAGVAPSDGPRDTSVITRDAGLVDRFDARADLPLDIRGDVTPDTAVDAPPEAPDSSDTADAQDDGPGGKSQGELCAANEECISGACADGVCCSNLCLGPCRSCNQPSANGACQGYPAGTDPELECMGGTSCNGAGACGSEPPPELPNGELCGAPSQCQSGYCKDGVCCDTACTTPCMACVTGTCQVVKKAEDIPECSGTQSCNPTGKCVDK